MDVSTGLALGGSRASGDGEEQAFLSPGGASLLSHQGGSVLSQQHQDEAAAWEAEAEAGKGKGFQRLPNFHFLSKDTIGGEVDGERSP